jgi:hypothetical protein
MLNLTMFPIEIIQGQNDSSSSFKVKCEYAWANNVESSHESHPYFDCMISFSCNVSLFNLKVSCEHRGEYR